MNHDFHRVPLTPRHKRTLTAVMAWLRLDRPKKEWPVMAFIGDELIEADASDIRALAQGTLQWACIVANKLDDKKAGADLETVLRKALERPAVRTEAVVEKAEAGCLF